MADNDYIINLVADIKGSLKSVEDLSRGVNKEVSAIKSSFSSVATFAAGALAAIGVAFSLKAAIAEASEFERDVNQLRIALGATGQATDKTVDSFLEFADSIQETTKFSDNAVLTTSSLIQNIAQLGQKDLKVATKAALDLSSALGIELQTAASLVGKAANGNVEAFRRYGIEIRKGRDDTETFSNALTVLGSRFGGASEKAVGTFDGAMAQLRNTSADLLKSFGLFVTSSPEIIAAIQTISAVISKLSKEITDSDGAVRKFVTGFAEFVTKVDGRQAVYDEIAKSVKKNTQSQLDLNDAVDEAIKLGKSYRSVRLEQEKVAEISAKKIRQTLEENTIEGLKSIEGALENAGKTEFQIVKTSRDEQVRIIADAERLGLRTTSEANALILASNSEFEKKRRDLNEKSNEYYAALATKRLEADKKRADETRARIGSLASGIVGSVSQGAAGVAGALAGVTGMLVDTVLPGLGGAAAQLLQFLAQGPEAVKAQIQAFVDNVPVIIDNIVLAIPAVIDALAANSGKIAIALSLAMPLVANRLAFELVKQSPTIAKSFVDGLISEAGRLINAVADGVRQAISQITNIAGGGGGILGAVTNPVGAISKKLKFSEGGVVPGGFPNDSFPILAQSGEGIVPNDTMRRLSQFLFAQDGGGSSSGGAQNITVNLKVGEQDLASVILNLSRQGFRTA